MGGLVEPPEAPPNNGASGGPRFEDPPMRQRAFESQRLLGWLWPAMVLSQGLQLLRVFIPSLAWYLRDTQGLSSLSLLPYAFGTFLVGYAAAWVWRALGSPRALWLTGGGGALIRLAEQGSRSPAAAPGARLGGVAVSVC